MPRRSVFKRLYTFITRATSEREVELKSDRQPRVVRDDAQRHDPSERSGDSDEWSATAYLRGDVKSGKPNTED